MSFIAPPPSNSTDRELVAGMRAKYPNPGPYIEAVFVRFEALVDETEELRELVPSCGEKSCAHCGTPFIITATKEQNGT